MMPGDGALYRLTESNDKWQTEVVAEGFGNAESVIEINSEIVVGGYRGHETAPSVKLLHVGKRGCDKADSTWFTKQWCFRHHNRQ